MHFGDDAAARSLARRVNEFLANLKRDRPDRFGAFAAVPRRDEISIGGLRQLQKTTELDERERRGVLGESAARLIPRLASITIGSRPR